MNELNKRKEYKRVLLVEDEEALMRLFRRKLNRKPEEEKVIVVLWASDLIGAQKLFDSYKDNLDAIVLDACVPGREINVLPLLEYILESKFEGSIIANSSISDYNIQLMEKGATHSCSKNEAPMLVRKLLT